MLTARSSPECQLYMRLHPCACGDATSPPSQGVHAVPDGLIALYAGACPRCERDRVFEFLLDPELPPADAYGGTRPSTILCPGELALESDRLAARWPASPAALDPEQRRAARTDLAWAIRALEEVVKLVPAGHDAVPATAFSSAAGQAAYAQEPGRFRTARLEARLRAYREILADLDGVD